MSLDDPIRLIAATPAREAAEEMLAACKLALNQLEYLEWSSELAMGEDRRDVLCCPWCETTVRPGCFPYEHRPGCRIAAAIAAIKSAILKAAAEPR